MSRVVSLALWVALVVGCANGGANLPKLDDDAGGNAPHDAGAGDAGTVADAGLRADAGTSATTDGAVGELDSGTAAMDAGTRAIADAGPAGTHDAGVVGDAGTAASDAGGIVGDAGPGSMPGAPCSVSGSGAAVVDTCGGDDVCVCPAGSDRCTNTGVCAHAIGRTYSVWVSRLTMAATKSDGTPWDDSSDPDPFVDLYVGTRFLGEMPTQDESYLCAWTKSDAVATTIDADTTIEADVWESDFIVDDPAISCSFALGNVATIRSRRTRCAMSSFIVDLSIEPVR